MESGKTDRPTIPVSEITPGATRSFERTFTVDEVQAFGALSGDLGVHHLRPRPDGRVMVQGLLVAAIPTRAGGEMNFIARVLSFEFLRPVYTGDIVRCDTTVVRTKAESDRLRVEVEWTCTNQDGIVVMRGTGSGVVRLPSPSPDPVRPTSPD